MHLLSACVLVVAVTLPVLGQSTAPEGPSSSLAEAHRQLELGKAAEAIVTLQKLAALQPPVKGVEHEFGIAYYRTGKLIEAQRAFAAAIREDPSDVESVQMEGLTLYRLGQPAAAIPFLERVRQWTPNANTDANYVLGLCYLNSRRYDEARGAFAAEFGIDADSAPAYLLLGNMLMNANLPELAAQQANKALQLSPNLPLAHFMLGEVYLYKSNVEEATQEFEQERRINPGYAATYDRLGDVYSRSGKFQQAQEALTKALSLDTSSTGPFIQMGKVLLLRRDPQTAVMYLKHAEKMDPGNFITHTLLAQAYHKLGQEEDARRETDLSSKIHVENQLKLEPVR